MRRSHLSLVQRPCWMPGCTMGLSMFNVPVECLVVPWDSQCSTSLLNAWLYHGTVNSWWQAEGVGGPDIEIWERKYWNNYLSFDMHTLKPWHFMYYIYIYYIYIYYIYYIYIYIGREAGLDQIRTLEIRKSRSEWRITKVIIYIYILYIYTYFFHEKRAEN